MRRTYFIILLAFLGGKLAFGQKPGNWTDFDTIQEYDDKILVDFKTYSDSNLTEEGQAFLYQETLELRKSKWLPRFFETSVSADSVVLHGVLITQGKGGRYRIGSYENGEKVEMTYYDPNGTEIGSQEFYGNLRSQRDPEQGTNRFFINGTIKK